MLPAILNYSFLIYFLMTIGAPLLCEQDSFATLKQTLSTDSFGLGRLCTFQVMNNTPNMIVYYPDLGECRSVICGPTLNSLTPIAIRIAYLRINLQYSWLYKGGRRSSIAEWLAQVMLPPKNYPGKVLIDEYEQVIPMEWIFDTASQLKAIINTLSKQFSENNITPKAVPLLVSISSLNEFNSLTEEECDFLTSYFKLIHHTDPLVKNYYNPIRSEYIQQSALFYASKPEQYHPHSTYVATYLEIEKTLKKLEVKKIVPAVLGFIVLAEIMSGYKSGRDGLSGYLKSLSGRITPARNQNPTQP